MKDITLETKDGALEIHLAVHDKDFEKLVGFINHKEAGIGLFLVRKITLTLHGENEEVVIMEESP